MTSLIDQEARNAIRNALDETLVVEAAAGTGKTTELVLRILALLRTGTARLSGIVAVTFTEKAAGEMKLRLRTEIDRARADSKPEERQRLDQALSELEAAHIGTIHAFCAELLRERPIEAKVDPLFVAADESIQERIFDEAFERWFGEVLSDPPEGVRRVLRKRGRDRETGGPRSILRRAGLQLIGQRDFQAAWRRDPFDRETEIDRVLDLIRETGSLYLRAHDQQTWLAQNLAEIHRTASEIDRREDVSGAARDYDGIEEEFRTLFKHRTWKYMGGPREFGPGLSKESVIGKRDATRIALEHFLQKTDADLAACLHRDLLALVRTYTRLKDASGKLDFLDLLVVARNLVVHSRDVRSDLQRKYTHILVDEFQDTDPLQAEILLLLAADDPSETDYRNAHVAKGKLFVVGDPKQSIYRFRRADVVLYERIKNRLTLHGARVVFLQTSFRSVPKLQAAINAAFEPLMLGNEDGSQAAYVPLEAFREDVSSQPSLVALPVPRPYSANSGKVANYWIDQSIPDAVGAFVSWLTEKSGWTVFDKESGERIPLLPKHVCLLFRRFVSFGDDVTRPYVRALEQRRVPHVLVGGKSLYQREEVMALKNGLVAIEWPDDELSVFATLKGPLFALPDEALLTYRARHKALHPMRPAERPLQTELEVSVQEALDILSELHRTRNQRPIADTMAELLERTRAHAGIAIWPTGEQALANLMRLQDDARRFEAQGAISFRAFVRKLEDAEERGGAAEAPVVEEGTDGVRIMTVHKAKGLEFPVVILVDPTCPLTQRDPSRFVDTEKGLWVSPLAGCTPIELLEQRERMLRHDEEEAVRLMYVATTRARDLLVVPVVGDEAIDAWLSPLNAVLYPKHNEWRTAAAASGCPNFGDDSVLERPGKTERDRNSSVRPGLHNVGTATTALEVVWWDPRALSLDAGRDAGLRHARILSADQAGGRDTAGEREHAAWVTEHRNAREMGAKPTYLITRVTEMRDKKPNDDVLVTHETTTGDRAHRPRGKSFGILVHAILAIVPLDATEDIVTKIARAEGRSLMSTVEEIQAATVAVLAALVHPVLVAARNAIEVRRESPISFHEADGSVLVGVLDLAYREESGAWVIVDFKTDLELGRFRSAYEEQARTYARAVFAATEQPVRCVLLSV